MREWSSTSVLTMHKRVGPRPSSNFEVSMTQNSWFEFIFKNLFQLQVLWGNIYIMYQNDMDESILGNSIKAREREVLCVWVKCTWENTMLLCLMKLRNICIYSVSYNFKMTFEYVVCSNLPNYHVCDNKMHVIFRTSAMLTRMCDNKELM